MLKRLILPFVRPIIGVMLFRQGPETLPQSTALLAIYFMGLTCMNVLQMLVSEAESNVLRISYVIEPLVISGIVFVLLTAMRFPQRIVQTACAMLGVMIGFSFLSLVVYFISSLLPGGVGLMGFLVLGLIFWMFSNAAFVFGRALEIPSFTAYALALTYTLIIISYPQILLNAFGVPIEAA